MLSLSALWRTIQYLADVMGLSTEELQLAHYKDNCGEEKRLNHLIGT